MPQQIGRGMRPVKHQPGDPIEVLEFDVMLFKNGCINEPEKYAPLLTAATVYLELEKKLRGL